MVVSSSVCCLFGLLCSRFPITSFALLSCSILVLIVCFSLILVSKYPLTLAAVLIGCRCRMSVVDMYVALIGHAPSDSCSVDSRRMQSPSTLIVENRFTAASSSMIPTSVWLQAFARRAEVPTRHGLQGFSAGLGICLCARHGPSSPCTSRTSPCGAD